ncbi:thioredoxin-like domain-containing protein [Nostoc sp. CHAB 5715]|uniref:thioredoxin-like domain-containing protein n=1 Tax=Nostoc sp. CHAB 5715 TaxID=2780400 RepID=UPI001E633863|nr:thioredoxin-like domain-containing protein [Nostoc sp. CHAB 5715]MCC5620439.1 redoxin domain-containing protein [Nostoc sp. CHAB 5715]
MIPRVRAPELPQNYSWLNTEKPLSLKQFKGRVVILDFWTYCCINCLHILPNLKYLEQKYKDSLTVIGVHSAKFDNEKETENIRQAILRYDIEHPVLVDNNFRVWEEYAVRAWPTLIIIDPEGYVIGQISGEGNRDTLDELIQKLIQQHQDKGTINFQELSLTLEKQRQPLITPLAFPGKVLATPTGLFIADSGHHRLIMSSFDGEILHLIGTGKSGLTDGAFNEAQFFAPQGMAYDAENQILYVADTENHTLRRVDLKRQVVETIAGTGEQSRNIHPHGGAGLETALNSPWDLVKVGNTLFMHCLGVEYAENFLWVADTYNHKIKLVSPSTGNCQTVLGDGTAGLQDGQGKNTRFFEPSGLSILSSHLYIADTNNHAIRRVDLNTLEVTTLEFLGLCVPDVCIPPNL